MSRSVLLAVVAGERAVDADIRAADGAGARSRAKLHPSAELAERFAIDRVTYHRGNG
jgi:hypothetical protein